MKSIEIGSNLGFTILMGFLVVSTTILLGLIIYFEHLENMAQIESGVCITLEEDESEN